MLQQAMFDDVQGSPGNPTLQGMQTGAQLAQIERFEQVVVGTGLQPGDAVADAVAGSQHQYRQCFATLPQPLQQLEAVFIGQAQIQHHHIEACSVQHGLGGGCGRHPIDIETLGIEAGYDPAGYQLVVFAKQYVHGNALGPKAQHGGERLSEHYAWPPRNDP